MRDATGHYLRCSKCGKEQEARFVTHDDAVSVARIFGWRVGETLPESTAAYAVCPGCIAREAAEAAERAKPRDDGPHKCCAAWADMLGPALVFYARSYYFYESDEAPAICFCPWCGAKVKTE